MVSKKHRSFGYTLIEVLVVLFIVSIVTGVALLSIHQNENRALQTVANELAQMITLAEEEALLKPAIIGINIQEHGFQFSTYQTTSDGKKIQWIPITDSHLAKRHFDNQIQLNIPQANPDQAANLPQIIISTNGDITPFTVYIGKTGAKPRYTVRGMPDGTINVLETTN